MHILDDQLPESGLDAETELTDLTVLGTAVLYDVAVELANRECLACFETCTGVKCPHRCAPVMVPLLLYCYAAGVYGSQRIEELSCKEENLKRLCGDKWVQDSQIRCFRREHRELLRRCLAALIQEARLRLGTTAQSSTPAGQAPKGLNPKTWACEVEADARIRLAIQFDSMELDA